MENRNSILQRYKVLMVCLCGVFLWITVMACTVYAAQAADSAEAGTNMHEEMASSKGRRVNKTRHLQVEEVAMERPTFVASQYLQDMSLEEKVGQMIFLHYQGENVKTLKKYQFGGIILFADFFKGKSSKAVVKGIAELQETGKIPMLIGVDEEGGSVVRVSKYKALVSHKFLSPQELYAAGGMEEIIKDTGEKSKVLLEYGINVNLAPVADVSTNRSDYIYARTFGRSAAKTAKYVEAVVGEMSKKQIGSVLKHFPGYGNNRDTHKGFAVDKRSYDSFTKSDFLPFQAGIEAGADSVLVSHNIVNCMDDKFPASLSPKVHGILRGDMHFNGVIMTDDLAMDAISEADFGESPAVLAVMAGNDMIITMDYKRDVKDILQAVKDGKLSEKQIDQAVLRVLSWKLKLEILDETTGFGDYNISER